MFIGMTTSEQTINYIRQELFGNPEVQLLKTGELNMASQLLIM